MELVVEISPCGDFVRYKNMLGRGAFKDVYNGSSLLHKFGVAWNQILVDDDDSPSLYNEAILLKSLDHANIMTCYSFWLDQTNKSMNIITELFSCGSLRQYVKKLGSSSSISVETIKDWGRQILQGLHYLHTRSPPIVHRDLKCDNIFIHVINGQIKIGDFGFATGMEQGPLRALVGTPEFMAPEYYDEEYNELVDVYAFGMCLMELVTLEYPYSECTNAGQIFKKVSTGVKPRALEKVKNGEVRKMIEKCLLPASSRPSAMELLNDPFFKISMERIDSSTSQDMDDESILSGISALYDSMSLPSSCYGCSSSVDDVSMNSRITVASWADLDSYEPSSN